MSRAPIPPSAVPIEDLSNDDLELANATFQAGALTICNWSLLEALKAGTWFHFGSGAALAVGGALVGPLIPDPARQVVMAALLVGAGIGLAGGNWHRRRGLTHIAEGVALEQVRDRIRGELGRRGMGE